MLFFWKSEKYPLVLIFIFDNYLIIPSSTHLYSPRIQFITDGLIKDDDWCSNDENSSNIELYFLNGYSFKMYSYTFVVREGNEEVPTSWIIKGYTGTNWITLDQKAGIRSNSQFRHFNVISATEPIYKIQFTQTAKNVLGNYHFCISELELFGALTKDLGVISCNKFYANSFSVLNSILTSSFIYILI